MYQYKLIYRYTLICEIIYSHKAFMHLNPRCIIQKYTILNEINGNVYTENRFRV